MKKKLLVLIVLLALSHVACAYDITSLLKGETDPVASEKSVSDDVSALSQLDAPAEPYEPKADAEDCSARAEEIGRLLDEWTALRTEDAAKRFGVTEEDVTRRVETLTSLKNVYPTIVSALNRKKQIDAELAQQKSDAASPALTLKEKPPFSLKFYDAYIYKLAELDSQIDVAQNSSDRAAAYAETAQKLVGTRESSWRLARDNYNRDRTPATRWELSGASYQLESARAENIAAGLAKENVASTLAARKLEKEHQDSLKTYIRDNLDLEEKSFKAQIAALAAEEKKLEALKSELSVKYTKAAEDSEAAQLKCAAATDDARAVMQSELEAYEAERERLHQELDHLQGCLVILSMRKHVWTLRYAIARGEVDAAKIPALIKELDAEADKLDEAWADVQKDMLALQNRYSSVQKQIDAAEADGRKPGLDFLGRIHTALQASIDESLTYISRLSAISVQERAFIAELQEKYETSSIWDKTRAWWNSKVVTLLDLELWQSDGYAVRLREFLFALALIVFGTWCAKRVINMILWLVNRRSPIDKNSRHSLSRLLSFIAHVCIFLITMRIVGIPLTAFAFIGGAVAIAAGFGAQNLFKNMMSGVMLTFKRTFRSGNIIEIGDVVGKLTCIGLTSTVVRTFDGKDVVIPNSDLLERQVVNWSLSDTLLRCEIDVEMDSATSPDLVEKTLLAIAADNAQILKEPAPWVCYSDFSERESRHSDCSEREIRYRLYFWINQREAQWLRVKSDVCKQVLKKFLKPASKSLPERGGEDGENASEADKQADKRTLKAKKNTPTTTKKKA